MPCTFSSGSTTARMIKWLDDNTNYGVHLLVFETKNLTIVFIVIE